MKKATIIFKDRKTRKDMEITAEDIELSMHVLGHGNDAKFHEYLEFRDNPEGKPFALFNLDFLYGFIISTVDK